MELVCPACGDRRDGSRDRFLRLWPFMIVGAVAAEGCASKSFAPEFTRRMEAGPNPPYLGQPAPGLTPERFAPGVVCTHAIELNSVLSPDGREFYFTRVINGVDTMLQISFADGGWGSPRELLLFPGSGRVECDDMTLSPDGKELYFLSRGPSTPGRTSNYDIWRSDRLPGGWSTAKRVPPPVSTEADEYYPVIGPDGSLYVVSTRDGSHLFRFPREADGRFARATRVGHPFSPRDGDMCISPDGNCFVVSAQRPRIGGSWKSDLHVSFRGPDAAWSEFVRLDDTFNTPNHEWCPMFSPDGRFLFFSRRSGAYDTPGWTGTTDGDVYWVDARALEKYRPAPPRLTPPPSPR